MSIYKFIRKSKKNNLRITLYWKGQGYNILVEEPTSKGVIKTRIRGVVADLNHAITILEIIRNECTGAEELKDLIVEIDARKNMLIMWRTAEICGFYFFTIAF